ncbi:hypothetical protein VTI74DRAFT_10243 [Chaetomium olivicolor]
MGLACAQQNKVLSGQVAGVGGQEVQVVWPLSTSALLLLSLLDIGVLRADVSWEMVPWGVDGAPRWPRGRNPGKGWWTLGAEKTQEQSELGLMTIRKPFEVSRKRRRCAARVMRFGSLMAALRTRLECWLSCRQPAARLKCAFQPREQCVV